MLQSDHPAVNDRVVLEWHWPFLSVLDKDFLLFHSADPLGKLKIVGHRSGEHYNADVVRQFDDNFLPDGASLLIVDVVNLVEDDPLDIGDP